MKVTVCFGNVRVVVPCGRGDILVRDLIREATMRYKKATGKKSDAWVAVHNLQSQGGGILDLDDRLNDVVDDREQILAIFDDDGAECTSGMHHHHHLQQHHHQQQQQQQHTSIHLQHSSSGDCLTTSGGSSVGTDSPDLFHRDINQDGSSSKLTLSSTDTNRLRSSVRTPATDGSAAIDTLSSSSNDLDIDVTAGLTDGATRLHVRRGSEPALNQIMAHDESPQLSADVHNVKRWSATPIVNDPPTLTQSQPSILNSSVLSSSGNNSSGGGGGGGVRGCIMGPPDSTTVVHRRHLSSDTPAAAFKRNTNRLSIQFGGNHSDQLLRWSEAVEKAASLPRFEAKRKEPPVVVKAQSPTQRISPSNTEPTDFIVIRNEPGPLGIHVVPDYDRCGNECGILVQKIEPHGRIDRDGRLCVYDKIVELNGHNLVQMPLHRIQDLFKLSLTSPELRLKIVRARTNGPHGSHASSYYGSGKPHAVQAVYPRIDMQAKQQAFLSVGDPHASAKIATVSPTKKVPSPLPLSPPRPLSALSSPAADAAVTPSALVSQASATATTTTTNSTSTGISKNLKGLLGANTKRIGRKIDIDLIKGPHGLGFSITTRDNPTSDECPIYIKNINPKGAAVEDKRLQIGDRLLEVNGTSMTDKSQMEAVTILRNIPAGSKVHLIVSRQDDIFDSLSSNIANDLTTGDFNEKETPRSRINAVPPTIPPLPQSHLVSHLQNRLSLPAHNSDSSIDKMDKQSASSNEKLHTKSEESLIFPWKHREIMTLNIPVHNTEKAGLGISVKGKTSGNQDLGIFIKSVIHGGAASRDRRLRTNDQLLNVNGVSLLHQSNSEAMETLRKAMLHTAGPIPGNITLTIARRMTSHYAASKSTHFNNMDHSFTDDRKIHQSDTTSNRMEQSNTSNDSTNTVIFNPNSKFEHAIDVRDSNAELMGAEFVAASSPSNSGKQLRNESYYKAAHDTWLQNTTIMSSSHKESSSLGHKDDEESRFALTSPSKSNSDRHLGGEHGSYEQSSGSSVTSPVLPPFDQNSVNKSLSDIVYDSQLSLENQSVSSTNASGSNAAVAATFARDAFGRQSMSEKRHATLDAKSTDTYQRTKKLREERKHKEGVGHPNLVRVGSLESVVSVSRTADQPDEYPYRPVDVGPSLGMKKSSSLESLQTMVQEIQMQEDQDLSSYHRYIGAAHSLKVIRGKGCEDSIRAAVVDSHQPYALSLTNEFASSAAERCVGGQPSRQTSSSSSLRLMTSDAQRLKSGSGAPRKHWLVDDPSSIKYRSDQQTLPRHLQNGPTTTTAGAASLTGAGVNDSSRQQYVGGKLVTVAPPRKKTPIPSNSSAGTAPVVGGGSGSGSGSGGGGGIFKGIGSMFRFGKHRKVELQHGGSNRQPITANQLDDNTTTTSHPRLAHRQTVPVLRCSPKSTDYTHNRVDSLIDAYDNNRNSRKIVDGSPITQPLSSSPSRNVKHRAKSSTVPPTFTTDHRPTNNALDSSAATMTNSIHAWDEHGDDLASSRLTATSYFRGTPSDINANPYLDNHHENHRLSTRHDASSGRTKNNYPVPFTHYVNYNELQNHLSRKQHQYHSQRQTRPDNQLRPVSNYYEYETVQSTIRAMNANHPNHPRHYGGRVTGAQHHQQFASEPVAPTPAARIGSSSHPPYDYAIDSQQRRKFMNYHPSPNARHPHSSNNKYPPAATTPPVSSGPVLSSSSSVRHFHNPSTHQPPPPLMENYHSSSGRHPQLLTSSSSNAPPPSVFTVPSSDHRHHQRVVPHQTSGGGGGGGHHSQSKGTKV